MVKNLINEIEQAMLSSLNNEQLAQLRKVLDYTFRNIVVTEKDAVNTESNNQILVENFISAKKVEGCSPNSIAYYRSTINNALIKLGKEVIHITTCDFTISWVAVRSFLYDSFSLYAAHNLSAKIRCSSMGGRSNS